MATILLVEDHDDLRANIRFRLELDHHRVVEAADGAEASQYWKSFIFDLIITDFSMPGMNGQEVIRMVSASQPTLPIILMSDGIEESVLLCILHRFPSVRYLPKQVISTHLPCYLRDALRMKHAMFDRLSGVRPQLTKAV
ncbi:MAG: response regulator [Nitrospira sp.]|nr:response regulator [Nitrospira sp.]